MSYRKLTPLERIYFTMEALTVIQSDPFIAEVMTDNGYPPERILDALTMHADVLTLTKRREEEFGNQLLATKSRNDLFNRLRKQYGTDRQIIRQVIPNNRAEFEAFGLNKPLKGRREQIITQAQFFYQQILSDDAVLTTLQDRFAMTRELFESRLAEFDGLVQSMLAQQVQKSEARLLTIRRDKAMEELDKWMGVMLIVARRAFKNDERHLEKLGIAVASGAPRPKKEEKPGEQGAGSGQEGGAATSGSEGAAASGSEGAAASSSAGTAASSSERAAAASGQGSAASESSQNPDVTPSA